jgi:hypothetical protein
MTNPNETQQTHFNELRTLGIAFTEYGIYSLTVGQYAAIRDASQCIESFEGDRVEGYFDLLKVKAKRYGWK